MSIPQKGSRRLIVGENTFYWTIRSKPTYSQNFLGPEITAVVQLAESKGSILRITFPFSRPDAAIQLKPGTVTPKLIEQCITNAISLGWKPDITKGVFDYKYGPKRAVD